MIQFLLLTFLQLYNSMYFFKFYSILLNQLTHFLEQILMNQSFPQYCYYYCLYYFQLILKLVLSLIFSILHLHNQTILQLNLAHLRYQNVSVNDLDYFKLKNQSFCKSISILHLLFLNHIHVYCHLKHFLLHPSIIPEVCRKVIKVLIQELDFSTTIYTLNYVNKCMFTAISK